MRFSSLTLNSALLAALATSLAVTQSPRAESTQQRPVFAGATDLIEVQAVVTDKRGSVVRGLTRDDFQVTENDRPQDVTAFTFIDIPLPPSRVAGVGPAAPASGLDVATNVLPHERRIYVLVLDGFNVDATRSTSVRKLARQFIDESLGPTDSLRW